MPVVLDTDVVVAGVRSRGGASRAVLVALREGRLKGLISVPLLLEYEAVLGRPEHLDASGASLADVGVIVDTLVAVMEPVEVHFAWRPLLADPADDMVLETAINGRADVITTFNLRHYGDVAGRFGIEVRRPAEILKRVRRAGAAGAPRG